MYDIILVVKLWQELSQTNKNDIMNEFLFQRNATDFGEGFETFLAKKFDLFEKQSPSLDCIPRSADHINGHRDHFISGLDGRRFQVHSVTPSRF
jgi:uncharacterized protein YheU (UPF0270 family)